MDDMNIEDRLEKIENLVEENHKILKSMQSTIRWGRFFMIIKWGVIIVVTVGTFLYIQPYFEKLNQVYTTLTGSSLPSMNFADILKKF